MRFHWGVRLRDMSKVTPYLLLKNTMLSNQALTLYATVTEIFHRSHKLKRDPEILSCGINMAL